MIDRIQNSKKGDFDDEVFEAARNLIASHHAKFAREGYQMPGLPDDQITAQFLAIAEWPRLCRMLHDLLTERQQTSYSWGWYVTVALQRIHGISPDKLRQVREKLRNTETPRAGTGSPMPVPSRIRPAFASGDCSPALERKRPGGGLDNFREQLRALATSKSIR